jgi:nitrate/nitrite-specific signal transduction histidine kinase
MAFTGLNVVLSVGYLSASPGDGWPSPTLVQVLALAVGELAIMLIVYFVTLRTSHHITGPVYVFEKRLSMIQRGDLSAHSHLRREDQFHEIELLLNDATDDLRKRLARMKDLAGVLKSDLGANPRASSVLEALEAELAHFQTDPTSELPSPSTKSPTS